MRPNPQNEFFTTKNLLQFHACLAYLKLNSFPTWMEKSYPWSKTALNLVINRVRFTQKNLQKKKFISIQERTETQKTHQFF